MSNRDSFFFLAAIKFQPFDYLLYEFRQQIGVATDRYEMVAVHVPLHRYLFGPLPVVDGAAIFPFPVH